MSFQIELDKYEEAYSWLVRKVQTALMATFAEEAETRNLTQADIARELGIDESVVSRRLHGSGNSTLRTISEMYAAMDRDPLSNFPVPQRVAQIQPVDPHNLTRTTGVLAIAFEAGQPIAWGASNDPTNVQQLAQSFSWQASGPAGAMIVVPGQASIVAVLPSSIEPAL